MVRPGIWAHPELGREVGSPKESEAPLLKGKRWVLDFQERCLQVQTHAWVWDARPWDVWTGTLESFLTHS